MKAGLNRDGTIQLFPQKKERENVQLFPLLYINLLLKFVSLKEYRLFYKYCRFFGLELRQAAFFLQIKTYTHGITQLMELREL